MASPGMRTPGGRSKERGEMYGILVRGGKYIVHLRLPGPGGKKTWMKRNDLESAQRLVEICLLHIDAFSAFPRDHPNRNVGFFQKEAFEEYVLQQLEADRNSHQELAIPQRDAMEDSTHDIDDGRIDESMVPTDASVSSFGTEEVGMNFQNDLPQHFALSFDAEPQAAGFRDSVPVGIALEGPPTQRQARENQVIRWEFMEKMLREYELEEEEMQRRHTLEREREQQRFRRYVLLGHEVATESGKQEVLKAWDTCVRDGDVATARVGSGKLEAEEEGTPTPENKEEDSMEFLELVYTLFRDPGTDGFVRELN